MFAGLEPGGQLMLTTEVENWPGEDTGIMGPELVANMRKQAERFGTEVRQEMVTSVDFSERPFTVATAKETFKAETVIIATGASALWLGIPGEERLMSKGVSACATCDGFFFKDQQVVVVGGGDSAMEEATFLTRFATKVTILVRGDALKASKPMQARAMNNEKITILFNTSPTELLGEAALEKVVIANNKTGETSEIPATGYFAAIGHKPNTDLFKDFLELDIKGYLKHAPDSTKTNIPGVFACGDVIDPYYRQAVTAAGSGCMAALEAERFLSHGGDHA
jgi:thioredoxin reductase (NADPH)